MTGPATPPVAVIGGGGHAKVVLACLRELALPVSAVFDDDSRLWGGELLGVPITGPIRAAVGDGGTAAVLALGDNATRRDLARRLDLRWITAVHPRAFVDPAAELGTGTVVCAGAVVQPGAEIGAHAIVNTGASVDHDCRVGDFVHLAPGVRLAGRVTVGDGTLVGIGSTAIPGVSIGEWSVVGAGASVVGDLPARVTAVGCPARAR